MISISSSDYFSAVSKCLIRFCHDYLGKKSKLINARCAIGIKNSKRTAYGWHQEKPYYKNTDTLHFQFPILYPCSRENGTMSVLQGSHELGYVTGVSDTKLHSKAVNTLVPLEIEVYKNKYPEKHLNMSLNDLSMFDQNLIHKSNKNLTEHVRFAGIIRLQLF